MSWSATCVLDWKRMDIERVRATIEQAVRDCAKKWPLYAGTTIEVDQDFVHVMFPAILVKQRGWETEPPTYPARDGTYCGTFRHYSIDPDPDYDGECGVSLDSNTSANRNVWMTASYVLDRMTELLGGRLRD